MVHPNNLDFVSKLTLYLQPNWTAVLYQLYDMLVVSTTIRVFNTCPDQPLLDCIRLLKHYTSVAIDPSEGHCLHRTYVKAGRKRKSGLVQDLMRYREHGQRGRRQTLVYWRHEASIKTRQNDARVWCGVWINLISWRQLGQMAAVWWIELQQLQNSKTKTGIDGVVAFVVTLAEGVWKQGAGEVIGPRGTR
jgi:hypothetical protein